MDCCFSSVIGLYPLSRIFYTWGLFLYPCSHLTPCCVSTPLVEGTLAVGTIGGPVHLHFQFVSKAGRGSPLCSSYKDTSEGGTLWDPPATKMQLQSKADLYAVLGSLANQQQVALRDKGMTQVLDPENCFSTDHS